MSITADFRQDPVVAAINATSSNVECRVGDEEVSKLKQAMGRLQGYWVSRIFHSEYRCPAIIP